MMSVGINIQRGITVFATGGKPFVIVKMECNTFELNTDIPRCSLKNSIPVGNNIRFVKGFQLNPHRNSQIKEGWLLPLARGLFNKTMHPISKL